eukprot:12072545-Karenia_brevis.AAC.1
MVLISFSRLASRHLPKVHFWTRARSLRAFAKKFDRKKPAGRQAECERTHEGGALRSHVLKSISCHSVFVLGLSEGIGSFLVARAPMLDV